MAITRTPDTPSAFDYAAVRDMDSRDDYDDDDYDSYEEYSQANNTEHIAMMKIQPNKMVNGETQPGTTKDDSKPLVDFADNR